MCMDVKNVIVIGGGPAGLMAAETLLRNGVKVTLYEGQAALGKKFLVAGSSGLNLTRDEDFDLFLQHYGDHAAMLAPILKAFGPQAVKDWLRSLDIPCFVGSSRKVFPQDMKAGKLLHNWIGQLKALGLKVNLCHRWVGWEEEQFLFDTESALVSVRADAAVLALGGASWPQTGSDAAWVPLLTQVGIPVAPLKPANCGFEIAWSDVMRETFAGAPVKTTAIRFTGIDGQTLCQQGEFVITEYGLEGNLIYHLGSALRKKIETDGFVEIRLDLLPDWPETRVQTALNKPRGKRSLSSYLSRSLGLKGVKLGLLWEAVPREAMQDTEKLAAYVKNLPLRLEHPRPIEEAISTAGGVDFAALDARLMLKEKPGVFCAGGMLDWEAPTGGYLINGCLATGRWAAFGLISWLKECA